MIGSSAQHASFVIERHFKVAPHKVFAAWSSAAAKQRWLRCDPAMEFKEFSMDFRPGGREINRVTVPGGEDHVFQGWFLDIVPDRRIIYAYDMHLGERRISTSLATVVFDVIDTGNSRGTRMTFTEQIVFLDGYSDREERIRGTEVGLDNLVLSLQESPAQMQ